MTNIRLGRRDFLRLSTQAAGAFGLSQAATVLAETGAKQLSTVAPTATLSKSRILAGEPWYRRAVRWGQTNITERDPLRYDIAWWRDYWKRTAIQGVIINARRHRRLLPKQVSVTSSGGVP
jgi:hypothetical protein